MQGEHFATCNAEVETGSIRRETLNGRDHLVAPVVAVREMVLKGELLPQDEIAASEPAWNGRTLPVGHPQNADGEFVSANSPEVHDSETVGTFFGADATDGALTGEIWVDIDESKRLASETGDRRFVEPVSVLASHADDVDAANVLDGVSLGETADGDGDAAVNASPDDLLEVSTAYFYRRQEAMGTHDGQSYEATQHDIRPDHLALLPNAEGECSAEDGCGAPRVHVHAAVDDGAADESAGGGSFGATDGAPQEPLTNFCGDNDTMSNTTQWLASHTEFDRETLEGMGAETRATLRESVEAAAEHTECDCGGEAQDDQQNTDDGDGEDAEPAAVPDAVAEKLASLEATVETLREQQQAQQRDQAREHAERIVAAATSFDSVDEVFETLGEDPDDLAVLAQEFEASATTTADMAGRVGANAQPGSTSEEADDYLAMVEDENPTRFGGDAGAGGDD